MKQPLCLVCDDCLSKHAVESLARLAEFTRGTVEFKHLVDFELSGKLDDDWIPQIDAAKWIVVTTDRGKKKSKGGKLPRLCQAASLSYVMFSPALHQRNMFDKIRALLAVWPLLQEIKPGDPCTGHLLHIHNSDANRFVLKCVYRAGGAENAPKRQQDFLDQ